MTKSASSGYALAILACMISASLISTQENEPLTGVPVSILPAGNSNTTTTIAPITSAPTTPSTTTPKPTKTSKKGNTMTGCPQECSCENRRIICDGRLKLTSIPDWSKANVTYISLKDNALETLDMNYLPLTMLEFLDVSNNQIKTITTFRQKKDNSIKLKTLLLRSNQLTGLSIFQAKSSVEILDLSMNKIEDIQSTTFNNFPKLTKLVLEQSQIVSIDEAAFNSLTDLKTLILTSTNLKNHLSDQLFSKNQKLETVDLSNNSFIEVPFALRSTPSIKTLILNGNLMTSLRPSDFLNRLNLVNLEIKNCPYLTSIDELTFTGMINLKNLTISENPKLAHISKDAFKSNDDKTILLKIFDLRNNNISSMSSPIEFPNLKFDDILLEHNPWHCDCKLKWLLTIATTRASLIHCAGPELQRDMELSQFFQTVDCEQEKNEYHAFILGAFLIFLLALSIVVFIQKNGTCRRLLWKDQYGTIYYTKASFPTDATA